MRLFIGLDLPPPLRQALAALRGSVEHALWYPPESYHLTLQFIGDMRERHRQDDLDLALTRLRGRDFSLRLAGAGVAPTPSGGSRLWLGAERSDALMALQGRVESLVRREGVTCAKRRFAPHVSLGLLPVGDTDGAAHWLHMFSLSRFDPFEVSRVTLFRSHSGRTGPAYEALAHYPLDISRPHAEVEGLDPPFGHESGESSLYC
ncbi:2'-5' RNA ligase [Ameyamaea chiangmaiensis NBRC 103196]|uniref:RNA 2',3'-cyclic phosphodiesterase n=1 Tax=Ameyamaea chiangmaiensis TaxID=442969 RepID=A0A850P6R6_9PROT|nr:RNA 2',3'-cyclic phosphodiesterase [Ameyamaea chiangmaiensis]MBS4074345.1 RNA 2',3'-cyclic phosphodiesterase [Ameyamaea chiangmaiensis]NVN40307.1 RNA 2',3'-cyclic phosphodiesterase [Ameyamaea chiangmaiensis]GBQ71718.1 2'-5' RNA ligase [Ameyamaea chiangmaiensis NBRC 103196]